jgi:hypothetical protein
MHFSSSSTVMTAAGAIGVNGGLDHDCLYRAAAGAC